jgi:hypothetical protein
MSVPVDIVRLFQTSHCRWFHLIKPRLLYLF